ncbi:MAG: nitrogen regulation protein NR(II) [Pirellulaceae bacterium]
MRTGFANQSQAEDLFRSRYSDECRRVNRLMTWLMAAQWAAGIAFALFFSPLTWIGQSYEIHVHVWISALLGGAISGFAVLWMRLYPDAAHTRHIVAAMQVLWSALLIHLSGGRIETHFHAFASIAIVSTYRDWKVLVTATIIVAVDHLVRGVFYPMSAFGVVAESPYRWVEHTLWLLFEVGFLVPACRRLRNEIGELCIRQTELEEAKRSVDIQVELRTEELVSSTSQLAEKTEEAEKLALVARFTENGVMITDGSGRIEWVNDGFERITGYRNAEVVGLHSWDFLHGTETDPKMTAMLQDAIRRKTSFDGEMVKYRKSGEACWMSVEFRPISDQNGVVTRYITIERDITDRVHAEIERQRLNEQLVKASRNAGIAEMATGVLHNVGNVLNSVNVSVSLVQELSDRSAFRQLDRMSSLIQEHLDDFPEFVRTDKRGQKAPEYIVRVTEALRNERKKFQSEFDDLVSNVEHIKEIVSVQQEAAISSGLRQLINARELIEGAIIANKGTLANHSVQVQTYIDDGLKPFTSDKRKIEQILINLINNAKDAIVEAASTPALIRVRATQDQEYVLIEVADNGIGIDPAMQQKVFQHGFTTKASGHGFGLHSCANAAKELGGSLEVCSKGVGYGTTFSLRVPLVFADAKSQEVERLSRASS